MNTEDQARSNGMVGEYEFLHNTMRTRLVGMAGELAAANQRITTLTAQTEKQAEEIATLKAKPAAKKK